MIQVPLYNISDYIKNLRTSNKLSILQLSKKAGVHWRTIDRIEKGDSTATFKTVQKIYHSMNGPEEIILDPTHMTNPIQIIDEIIKETIDGIANPDEDNSTYEEDNVILKK